ncbi:MAG TPA: hypothetical protein V6D08_04565 [Candidatus Obscuribacterales bacterium]
MKDKDNNPTSKPAGSCCGGAKQPEPLRGEVTPPPAAVPAEGKSGQTQENAAAKPGEEKKEQPFFRIERDPDGPLRPHRAFPRAEMLIESPRVLITPEAYKRMCLYIEIAPKEVGWLGTVSRRPNGDFLIEEVFLVEQEVTSVETELTVEGREKLVLELLEKGDPGLEQANKLRFWGHSHVRMSTGPSGTDERTMEQFGTEGMPFYIRGIFTKLGRGEFTIYLYDKGYRILDAPWAVWDPAEGIILEPRRFPTYSFGTWGQGSTGGSIFGQRQEATVVSKDKPLPDKLVPDEQLRAEVTAEYEAKVSERRPFFRWFRKDRDDDDKPELTIEDADLIPTGFDFGGDDPPPQYVGRRTPPQTGRQGQAPAATGVQPEGNGGGILGWLLDTLFGSSPQPPAGVNPPPTSDKHTGWPAGAADGKPTPGPAAGKPEPTTGSGQAKPAGAPPSSKPDSGSRS